MNCLAAAGENRPGPAKVFFSLVIINFLKGNNETLKRFYTFVNIQNSLHATLKFEEIHSMEA